MNASLEARGGRVNQRQTSRAVSASSSSRLFRRFSETFDYRWPATYRKVRIEWQWDEGDVLFRPKGSDVRLVWHALDVLHRRNASEVFSEAMDSGQIRRAWPLPKTQQLFFDAHNGLVHRRGLNYAAGLNLPAPMLWNTAKDYLLASGDEVERRIEDHLLQDESFLRAQHWIANFNKNWGGVELQRGSFDELENLIVSLSLLLSPMALPEQKLSRPRLLLWFGSVQDEPALYLRCKIAEGAVSSRLLDVLNAHFEPKQAGHYWVRGFSQWGPSWALGTPSFSWKESTAHERLEALLLWHDFLRDKLPPEEIAALLTPFAT